MVGRKLSAVGCHFTGIKRITLFLGRIYSCHHTLPYLKNDAGGSPQVHMSPAGNSSSDNHKGVAHFSHADIRNSAVC